MPQKIKKFIVIDGNALLHRAFHALPPLTTKTGELVNAVYGFILILLKVLKDLKPDYLAMTFDRKEKTFRHEAFVEYKATRVKQPDELYNQITRLKEVTRVFNIPIFELAGYEADDLIGTLVRKASEQDPKIKNVIVTGDMDTMQLVDDNTEVFTLKKGITDTIIYDAAAVRERYGLAPEQMIDFKALRGDPSDNIPGVKGIGEKTAVELLRDFGTLEKVLAGAKNGDKKIKERYQKLLIEKEADAIMSKNLATIVLDVPIEFQLSDCEVKGFDRKQVLDLFQELGFKSLIGRIPETEKQINIQAGLFSEVKNEVKSKKEGLGDYDLIADKKKRADFLAELKQQTIFCFDTETTGLDTIEARLIGVGFSFAAGRAYYLPWDAAVDDIKFLDDLKKIFADEKIKKVGHNLKYDIEIMIGAGVEVRGLYFDTMIASYLLNPGSRGHDLDTLAFTELGHEMIPIEDLIGPNPPSSTRGGLRQGKGKNQITLAEVEVEKVAEYCGEDADYTWRLYQKLEKEIKTKNILGLFEKIEMPLIPVLVELELNGVNIDARFLNKLDDKIAAQQEKIDEKIFKLAKSKFNIDSPIQLKEILFEKLKISSLGLKKGKTGLSTAAAELEKLADKHPIVPLISEHRELAKLRSTYTTALPELVSRITGRVHASFNQTVTATGRLSSSNPNLQNIPIRTELGNEIRKAFVAGGGNKIIAADYSQIELRVVASLAKDEKMLEIFARGEDIHTATAAEIFGVKLNEVTKEMRRHAKTVNFGVLYGMGVHGLSTRVGISYEEAKNFIDKYYTVFAGVKKYMDETREIARRDGYVETLFGRVRYLPEINPGVQQIRAAAERMAINMPIQGTAADLMKLAMIEVLKEIKNNFSADEVKMILQVHDELVFEVKKNLVKKFSARVKEIMENVYQLRVPIIVDVEVGDNWGETEKI